MPRPTKATVEYFPHDANANSRRTLTILTHQFGNDGRAFWWSLLEEVSATENHVIVIRNPADWQYFAAKTNVSVTKAKQILALLASLGAIDPELYTQNIIWCQKFVDRLKDVYSRRKIPLPESPGVLFGKIAADINPVSDDINPVSVNSNSINVNSNPQSKVKYSRVNNILYSDKKNMLTIGEFGNVRLTLKEQEKLTKLLGQESANDLIERLSAYMKSRNKKYDSHYATILNWARSDAQQKQGGNNGHSKERGIPGNRPAGAFDDIES